MKKLFKTCAGLAGFCALLSSAHAQGSLLTFNTQDWAPNVGWGASGIYFDVEVSTPLGQGILLHDLQIDLHWDTAARDVRFYTISGPVAGQTNINNWTLQEQWTLPGTARGAPTALGNMSFQVPLVLGDGVHGFLILSKDNEVRYVRRTRPVDAVSASGDHLTTSFAWRAGGGAGSGFNWDVDDPFVGTSYDNFAPSMIATYEVIPEPAHAGLVLGLVTLGWLLIRRRRRA